MVTVYHLPPQKAPKQLTAYRPNTKLEEHLLAFLNHNNQSGFADEDGGGATEVEHEIKIDAVRSLLRSTETMAIIAQVALSDKLLLDDFQKYASQLAKTTGKSTGLMKCYHILARVMGYKSYTGLLYLNNAAKSHRTFIQPPCAYQDNPRLYKAIRNQNREAKRKQKQTAMIKNRRDPSTIRLKDFTA